MEKKLEACLVNVIGYGPRAMAAAPEHCVPAFAGNETMLAMSCFAL